MKVHVYERAVLTVGAALLVACLAALLYASLVHGVDAALRPARGARGGPRSL
jgi:hypothetical protein